MASNSFNSSSDFTLAHDPYEKFLQQEKFNKSLIPFDNSTKFAKKVNKFKASLWNARNNARSDDGIHGWRIVWALCGRL